MFHVLHGGLRPGIGHHAFFGLLLLVAAVAAVAVLVLALRDRHRTVVPVGGGGVAPMAPSVAMRILDERFARGEIDDEEYRRRRALLLSAP